MISKTCETQPYLFFSKFLNKKYNPNFSKTQQDDLNSMANGVMSPKGRVQVAFGNPLNIRLDEITKEKKDSEIIETLRIYLSSNLQFNVTNHIQNSQGSFLKFSQEIILYLLIEQVCDLFDLQNDMRVFTKVYGNRMTILKYE